MRCEDCGENKPDVEEVLDPYERDVKRREVWVKLCDDCYREKERDI